MSLLGLALLGGPWVLDQPRQTLPPRLTIVKTYDAFRQHDPARAARTQAALDLNFPACGGAAALFELLKLETPSPKTAGLIRQLDAADLPGKIERAFARASAALPAAGSMTVCLYLAEYSRGIPYLRGVGATAMGSGRIHLYLHPTADQFASVPYTIAHEYHHEAVRVSARLSGNDDVLVSEGEADYFALGLYPELRPPHTISTPDELRRAWQAFGDFRNRDRAAFRSGFMIAAPPSQLPLWAGYKLGFEVVRQYRTANGSRRQGWPQMSSTEMLSKFQLAGR